MKISYRLLNNIKYFPCLDYKSTALSAPRYLLQLSILGRKTNGSVLSRIAVPQYCSLRATSAIGVLISLHICRKGLKNLSYGGINLLEGLVGPEETVLTNVGFIAQKIMKGITLWSRPWEQIRVWTFQGRRGCACSAAGSCPR